MFYSSLPGLSKVIIYPSGKVIWVPSQWLEVKCDNEINMDDIWAQQDCRIKFGSWTFDGTTMNVTHYNTEWNEKDMKEYQLNCPIDVRMRFEVA